MELIGGELRIVSLSEALDGTADLAKAHQMNHAYYTHLVPRKITGKDGVTRIHWVSPEEAKSEGKKKLRLVHHADEGATADHHEVITREHGIDPKHLVKFERGDKVKVARSPAGKTHLKGTHGVFRGSLVTKANMTPRVSAKVWDPKANKYVTETFNINHLERTGDGDKDSKELAASKFERKDPAPAEAPKRKTDKEKFEASRVAVVCGAVFTKAGGDREYMVRSVIPDSDRCDIVILNPPKGMKKIDGIISLKGFQAKVDSGEYTRKALPTFPKTWKEKVVTKDPVTGKTTESFKVHETAKVHTWALEAGEFHRNGYITFDDHGKAQLESSADAVNAVLGVIWDNFAAIEHAVQKKVVERYPLVDQSDLADEAFFDECKQAIVSYNPYKGGYRSGGILARLCLYAISYATAKARRLSEIRKVSYRADAEAGSADSDADKSKPTALEVVTAKDKEPAGIDIATGFLQKQDILMLEEGLRDEQDFMSWLYEDPTVRKIMQDWTGIGVLEPTLSMKEAAEKLYGVAYSPETMKPYELSTIKTLLIDEYKRLEGALKEESRTSPDFEHILLHDMRLRHMVRRKREIAASSEKDFPTKKLEADMRREYDGGRTSNAHIAKKLIQHGVPLAKVGALAQVVGKIIDGGITPLEYHKYIGFDHAAAVDRAVKDMLSPHMMAQAHAAFQKAKGHSADDKNLVDRAWLDSYINAKTPIRFRIADHVQSKEKDALKAAAAARAADAKRLGVTI